MTLPERWAAVMMDNYGTPPLALASGDGAVVTDVDGKRYLDLLGGIAVNVLGHRHPAVIDAVTRQLNTLGHTSNLYMHEPGIALAEALVGLLGADTETRVFFCNSGAEANEVAFKLSRLTGRTKLVAAQEAFHGRTMGALALTGQPGKQAPFAPLPGDVTHVPYGDVDALAAAVSDDTAAVFLEPIMGESGVVVPPSGYLVAAREITARHSALLVLDEVQTGMGRTGAFFAHQHDGITPDVVTLAKGLGGVLPIGACLVRSSVFDAVFDSFLEKVEKPDPRFFEIALERSGSRKETTVHVGDFRGQVRRTYRNISQLLESEGATWNDIVRTTCYLRDIDRDYAEFNEERTAFFKQQGLDPLPASTGIEAKLCRPELLVEMEAIAMFRSRKNEE